MELPEPPHLKTLRGWCYRIHYREDVVYISGRVRETVDQEGACLSKSRYLYCLHFFLSVLGSQASLIMFSIPDFLLRS